MDNIFKRFLLSEALDFSKPIIGLSPSKDKPNIYYVRGFISFDVTKSDVTINNAIQKIKDDLAKQDLVVSGVLTLNVYGGASNYLNGPMNADFKNTNADDPFKLEKVVKSDKELTGESNKEKNVGYATNRANAVKDAILGAFPSQGAVANTYARIMDTGGVIDEKRDTNLYPIPGQQATFSMSLNVKKKEKEIAPFNAAEVFKKTQSNRTSMDSSYYGSENVKIGDKDVLMCKILSKNDTLGLKVDLPDIGLTKFQASITFDKNLNKYKIANKNGKQFTKQQWVWIYWYLTNEQNANKNCKALDYTELPSWLKLIDLNNVTFGAMNKEHEFVHDKAKHNLVKENKNMKRVKLKKTEIERIIIESMNELYKSTYNNAAAKAASKGDENLAMDFLKHSNDMGIPDEAAAKKNYHDRGNRYMFFSNLQQMRRQCDLLLDLDPNMIEGILENGHDWAQDHIAEAKNNMDQVFDFLMNETKKSGMELSMNIDDKDMMSERWSEKYKRSIDCNNPKGFSQKAHCQGRKKR